MITVIEKVRNLIEDGLKTDGRDVFDYESIVSSKIFTLTQSNVSASTINVYKNGILWLITPVAGSGVAWTRTLAIITITKTAHGLITGDVVTITTSSNTTALPLASYTVTKLTDNTFTVVGINAIVTSGTCTYTITANYSYSTVTGKITIIGTLAAGDSLEIDYSYYTKYSDTELSGYIRAAISYLVVEKYGTFIIKPPALIFPTPSESEENLIAIVAAIFINGNIRSYRTPEITITFNENESVSKRIHKLVRQFKKATGILTYIKLDETYVSEDDETI